MDTTFEVGKKYENGKGVFEVTAINGNRANIQYIEEDSICTLDVSFASKISIPFEQSDGVTVFDVPHTEKGINFYFSLGVILKHGSIVIHTTEGKNKEVFDNEYFRIKGCMPEIGAVGYYVSPATVKRWGNSTEIDFHEKYRDLIKIDSVNTCQGASKTAFLCSNAFTYKLFSLGFGLGSNHNHDEILSNTPFQYRADFVEGYSK